MRTVVRGWAPCAVGLILFGFTAPLGAQAPALEAGRKALDAGEPLQAVAALQPAAEAPSSTAALKGELALAQLAAGRHDAALATARAAVAAAPRDPAAARALGLVHAGRFEYQEALRVIDEALGRSRSNGGLLAAKGQVLWQLRRTRSAIDTLTTAAKDQASAGEAQYWLGRIFLFLGAQSEGAYPGWHEQVGYRPQAVAAFRAAAQARPAWYAPRLGLGLVLLADEEYAQALAAFDAAIERGPNVTGARVGRWRALKGLGRDAEVRTEVASAAASSDARMLAAAREGYGVLGMNQEAGALTTRLVDQFPDSAAAQAIAASRMVGTRSAPVEPASVIQQATAFIAAHPYSPQLTTVYDALVDAYQATPGAPIDAVVAAIDANIAHRPDASGYLQGANILIGRKAMLDKAIALAGASVPAAETFVNENLGSYKLEGKSSGSLARARSSAAEAAGWAYFLKGDIAQADARLHEADRLAGSTDVAIQYHLAELERSRNNLELAREHYLNALTVGRPPAPISNASKTALADIQVKLGNEAAEFESWYAGELERRTQLRHSEMLQSMVGKPAPDLRLLDVNGKQVDLRAERGNVILLNFFASW